jgi:hypothetical protein
MHRVLEQRAERPSGIQRRCRGGGRAPVMRREIAVAEVFDRPGNRSGDLVGMEALCMRDMVNHAPARDRP